MKTTQNVFLKTFSKAWVNNLLRFKITFQSLRPALQEKGRLQQQVPEIWFLPSILRINTRAFAWQKVWMVFRVSVTW